MSRKRWSLGAVAWLWLALIARGGDAALSSLGSPPEDDGFPIADPERFVTDLEASEAQASRVQSALRAAFLAPLRELDWDGVAASLSPDFRARFPSLGDGRAVADDDLALRTFHAEDLPILDARELVAALRSHVSGWTHVERAFFGCFGFLGEPDGRRAVLDAHLSLGGPRPDGTRGMLVTSVRIEAVSDDGEAWKLRRLDLSSGHRVDASRPPFRDVTDAVGFHFNLSAENRALRQDLIDTLANLTYGGLSAIDWNGDGFWDLLATEAANQAVLFLNDGRGGFVQGELPLASPGDAPSQFLFVDLDGDGLEELVGNRIHTYRGGRAWIGIYTRRNGQWVWLPEALEFACPAGLAKTDVQGVTAGDVDGDGTLDLFVACYESSASRSAEWNAIEAHDGDDNLLFINHGGLRFTEESDARGITGTQYTFFGHFFDFDADGDLDLYEGNDYGRSVLWRNRGDGTFEKDAAHALSRDPNFTMGLAIADWENDGRWSLHLSNMYSHAGQRIVPLARGLAEEMRARVRALAGGNQLFELVPDSRDWPERAAELGVADGGWSWACFFCDLDNDGDEELFVTSGYTSYRDRSAPDY